MIACDYETITQRCARVLGRHARDVLAKMSSITDLAEELTLETARRNTSYSEAVKVSFRGKSPHGPVDGFFICAFHSYRLAEDLARDIAVRMGLGPELADTREGVDNVLAELLNIIIGLTSADWIKIGLDISFDPPEKLGGHQIQPIALGAAVYLLTLKLDPQREISLFEAFRLREPE
ncbi:MAG: chemotaxis protein CheX [Deltaproteobacteria bacterium]|jgi:hypothetical protein|nr:chemotaxis protein CheX [Deltaproteobacteria bacterium]